MKTGSLNAERYGISQEFGDNPEYYASYGYKGHPGVDTPQKKNQPVYVEEGGRVTGVYPLAGTAGNMVTIKTVRKIPTQGEWRYLHLTSFKVKVGQKVKRGDVVGLAGNTGDSQGVHNHMDYRPTVPGTNVSLFPLNGYKGRRNPISRLSKYK